MAIKIGTQKVQKMVDEFQNNSSDDKPNEH
jgi:hypothetical protein